MISLRRKVKYKGDVNWIRRRRNEKSLVCETRRNKWFYINCLCNQFKRYIFIDYIKNQLFNVVCTSRFYIDFFYDVCSIYFLHKLKTNNINSCKSININFSLQIFFT